MKKSILQGSKAVADINKIDVLRNKTQIEIEQLKEKQRVTTRATTEDKPKTTNIPDGYKLVKIPKKNRRLNIVLNEEDYNKLKSASVKENISMNELLTRYIQNIKL